MMKDLIIPCTALLFVGLVFGAIAWQKTHQPPMEPPPMERSQTPWGTILAGPDLPKTVESPAAQASRKAAYAARQEREQERRAAADALVALCRRHIQGQYVSPEDMRAFTRCVDGR